MKTFPSLVILPTTDFKTKTDFYFRTFRNVLLQISISKRMLGLQTRRTETHHQYVTLKFPWSCWWRLFCYCKKLSVIKLMGFFFVVECKHLNKSINCQEIQSYPNSRVTPRVGWSRSSDRSSISYLKPPKAFIRVEGRQGRPQTPQRSELWWQTVHI